MKKTLAGADFRFLVRTILVLALIALSVWVLADGSPAQLPRRSFAVAIDGPLHNQEVTFDNVASCTCYAGAHGQIYKKYKFKVTNQSGEALDIAGGENSSILLFVAYPNSFHPTVTLPDARQGDATMTGSLPKNVAVTLASGTKAFKPYTVSPQLAHELGIQPKWTAYALPPAPNGVIEWETNSTTEATFPTYVSESTLADGTSYSDKRAGWGDWVFPIPVSGAVRTMSEEPAFTPVMPPEFYDDYFVVLGVAAVGADGRILGFAATPPASTLTTGSEF